MPPRDTPPAQYRTSAARIDAEGSSSPRRMHRLHVGRFSHSRTSERTPRGNASTASRLRDAGVGTGLGGGCRTGRSAVVIDIDSTICEVDGKHK